MALAGLLLAAGESTRMGTLKALLEWEGTTLLEYQVAQLRAARLGEVVVVLGHEASRLRALLMDPHPNPLQEGEGVPSTLPEGEAGRSRVRVIYNPDYRSGKTSSIRAGVAALSADASGVLVLGVDQPRPRDLLDYLVDRHGDARLSVPVQAGRRGHPPIFARAIFSELLAISEEHEGLREVFRAHAAEVNAIPVDSPAIHLNLNRPEDYAAARR
jgi:molybdenum cofactor cytidylyltransferase